MSAKTLLRGGYVLTLGTGTRNHARADVLIEDDRIAEIGPDVRSRGAEQIDATDTIIMPGFVDTHRHGWRSLFRHLGEPIPGASPVGPDVYGPLYTPDDVYAGTLISLLGAVEAGITAVVDWADAGLGTEIRAATLQAHADSGVRTVLVQAAPAWSSSTDELMARIAQTAGTDVEQGRAALAIGLDYPGKSNRSASRDAWSAARSTGMRIHSHVGLTAEDRGAVVELGAAGLLEPDVTLVHCSHLGDADLDAISASGANVSLSPSSEMAGGMGTPPIQMLLDRGIRPGLGIGDETSAPGDMFAQMRATNSIQHATMFDLKLAGKASLPTLLTTREVIRYATIDGARAVGLGVRCGSLEPGKQADVIVLRADRPNIAPINDPIGAVVWGMDTSNLDWVFVAGRALMRAGELDADVARARDLASAAHARIAGAAGLLSTTAVTS